MQAAQQEAAQLRSQVAAGEGTSGQLRQAQQEASGMRDQRDRLQEDVARLQAELADAHSAARQLHDAGMAANGGAPFNPPLLCCIGRALWASLHPLNSPPSDFSKLKESAKAD